jgi:class 3 adenylate cyclase
MTEPPGGRHAPGDFDLARDLTGGLPLSLIERWRRTGQTAADARHLLSDFAVEGYSVVSDSAGLTRLSGRLALLEVLALIDRPKRILHAYGRAVGGRAVGVWAADNAQLFHPAETTATTLLSALLSVQDEIERHCRIRIGIGVHRGTFTELAGGLYGAEADTIEEIAENHVGGGEIAVTGPVVDRLPADHGFILRRKDGLDAPRWAVYDLLDGPRLADPRPAEDERYPIPYSPGLHADLLTLERSPGDAGLLHRLTARHLHERTVVLIEREGAPAQTPDLALLRDLTLSAVMRETGLRLLPTDGAVEIKVTGPLAIYLFDEPASAVRFALRLRADLAEREIVCRIGVDTGPVLTGETPSGGRDIAGAPVNVASKMAQDLGRPGHVYLSEALRAHTGQGAFVPIEQVVSGVRITFFEG